MAGGDLETPNLSRLGPDSATPTLDPAGGRRSRAAAGEHAGTEIGERTYDRRHTVGRPSPAPAHGSPDPVRDDRTGAAAGGCARATTGGKRPAGCAAKPYASPWRPRSGAQWPVGAPAAAIGGRRHRSCAHWPAPTLRQVAAGRARPMATRAVHGRAAGVPTCGAGLWPAPAGAVPP